MDAACGGNKTRTLGAYLLAVRRGDPCPCCGAKLHDAAAMARRRGDQSGLLCVECGCELAEVRLPFGSGICRVLSPAA